MKTKTRYRLESLWVLVFWTTLVGTLAAGVVLT